MISDCLFKRNNTYYFRLNLPQDIAPYFSRKEIWKYLKTKKYKSAKTAISKLLFTTERLFLHLRSGMCTDTQMKQLVKAIFMPHQGRNPKQRVKNIIVGIIVNKHKIDSCEIPER